MKHPALLLCALLFTSLAVAADITLTDGQTFTNAKIISSSPGRVCIRHAGGLTQVEKTLLPPDLAARYPATPDAVAAEDAKHAEDAEKRLAKEEKRRETERVRPRRSTPSYAAAETPQSPSESSIKYTAERYAYRYFRDKYHSGSNDKLTLRLSITTEDPEPIAGWVDQWRVSGEANYTDYSSSGGSFQKDGRRFEAVILAPAGKTPKVTDFTLR